MKSIKPIFITLSTFLLFSFSEPRWNENQRETFMKDCTGIGNSKIYCLCFSKALDESVSPKKMISILKGNSKQKQEADAECDFNKNNL